MKLLIVTQKVDKNDDVLGFFHRWLKEFSLHVEQITVICLSKGEYNLPVNVRVLSLGKEDGKSRIKYIRFFYKYIWQERKNYQNVFVHMNEQYVLLGGIIWRFLGKPVGMWRNHAKGSFLTDVAVFFSNRVFCTSKFSYTAKFSKTSIMPVGIDTEYFKKLYQVEKKAEAILFLSRIAPVKKLEVLIEALSILKSKNIKSTLSIYGKSLEKDSGYEEQMKILALDKLAGQVFFNDAVRNEDTPFLYNQHSVFINTTPNGSFDKTILEAMSCETVSVSCNYVLYGDISNKFIFEEGNPASLAEKIEAVLNKNSQELESDGKELRRYVLENHSLSKLAHSLFEQPWKI